MSALDTVANYVPADTVRSALRQSQEYTINRDRIAAAIGEGFRYYDTYKSVQPVVFGGACIGAVLSGLALYKRRKAGAEANLMYGAAFLACSAIAWFTRPDMLRGRAKVTVPEGATPAQAQAAKDSAIVTWMDTKAAEFRAENPNFADQVFTRLVSMDGIRQQYQKLPAFVKAAVV